MHLPFAAMIGTEEFLIYKSKPQTLLKTSFAFYADKPCLHGDGGRMREGGGSAGSEHANGRGVHV
eukprot:74517-Amphidinium_carterae.1